MNVIKFKDQIRPGDALFNKYLKGKYAYWIQMQYIVPFEFIDSAQYVKFENDIHALIGWRDRGCAKPEIHYWDILKKDTDIEAWVDVDATEDANSIKPFTRHNQFSTDDDITIDEIKKFRTWLAKTLLDFDAREGGRQKNCLFDEDFTRVLQYYAGGMYDQCVKALSKVNFEHRVEKISMSDCGCSGGNLAGLYSDSITGCDPVYVYRKYMHGEMVKQFSQIEFWDQFPTTFLWDFKKYIDNIIALNLPLKGSSWISTFVDCTCQMNTDQMVYIELLRRLSKAINYIATEEIQGNKNFISKALSEWATDLYESMEWS